MKLKLFILSITLSFTPHLLEAQEVPARIEFANMDLRLTPSAIKDIQTDVDALTRSEKYFQKKLERVDMYMPIIERIFKEEGLPEDFKYLVIQESALISDAVSSSNAVGFWQFKEISGLENDLRIDRQIDERMNIVSSSRAAAAYLKSHNQYFDNWAYALIAYQRGRGGALDVIDKDNYGKTSLKITKDTYWYLKKFLAHKVAFENAIGTSKPPYYLKEIENVKGNTLKDIAKDESVPLELLTEYNKWVQRGKIPEDKEYTVVVPLTNLKEIQKLQNQREIALKDIPGDIDDNKQQNFPLIENYPNKSDRTIAHEIEINGLDGIYAPAGYTVKKIAETAGVDEYKFRKWNDLKITEELKTGKIYYLRTKRNRAKFYYHTVTQNENMWEISQKYGLKLKKLYRKNRMESPNQPKAGRVLWLRQNRPSNVAVEYREIPKPETPSDTQPPLEEKIPADSQPVSPAENKEVNIELENEITSGDEEKLVINNDSTLTSISPVNEDTSKLLTDQIDTVGIEVEKITVSDSKLNDEEMPSENEESIEDEEVFDENQFMDYSIRKGDTFFSISNQFNMKISTLLAINNLTIRDTLSIDQNIKVNKMNITTEELNDSNDENSNIQEVKTESSDQKEIKHEVSSGETMYALAKKYSVSLKEILEWNKKESYDLKEGEIIIIKKK